MQRQRILYVDEIWKKLKQEIKQIFHERQLYTTQRSTKKLNYIEEYCIKINNDSNLSPYRDIFQNRFYEYLKGFLKDYLKKLVCNFVYIKSKNFLLDFYSKQWLVYKSASTVLNVRFSNLYMNGGSFYHVYRLTLITWRKGFFAVISGRLTNTMLKLIDEDRKGNCIDHSLIRYIISSYVELGFNEEDEVSFIHREEVNLSVYEDHFEKKFLHATRAFYKHESREFLNTNTVLEYIKHVEKRLEEERIRANTNFVSSCLDSTLEKLMATCKLVLIENQLDTFITEFQYLLSANKSADLKCIYSFLTHTPWILNELKNIFQNHIENCGNTTDPDNLKIYIQNISAIHKKYSALVLAAFNNDEGFASALDGACEILMKNASQSYELLAKHCGILVKKSFKKPMAADLEDNVYQLTIILKYIERKGIFENLYSKILVKRWLDHTSAFNDAEAAMISKLKETVHYQYTNKFRRIFHDMCLHKDLNNDFKQHFQNSKIPMEIDFSIKVLSHDSWHLDHSSNISLPPELRITLQHFDAFYTARYPHRNLHWQHHISTGELVSNCFRKTYTLEANTFPMAVLLQFNDQTKYSVKLLLKNTKLEQGILIQVLQTLLQAQLLTCLDDKNSLTINSIIELDFDYNNDDERVNINRALQTEHEVEQRVTQENIVRFRSLIKAAIIRVMNKHKKLSHLKLVTKVDNQLSFVKRPMIENCIKNLIEDKYLQREEGQKNVYKIPG